MQAPQISSQPAKPAARRFVILVSGRGSNMRAIVEAARAGNCPADIVAVIANRADSAGLAWAAEAGVPTVVLSHRDHASREAFDAALAAEIDRHAPDYVLLAGFMRILTSGFVDHYRGRLINIHPSLLPMFPGLATHAQALAAGVRVHGCSVHFVTPVLDHGPILAQGAVPVLDDDTEATLAARVLDVEHRLYPRVVRWLAEGRVRLEGNRVIVDGENNRLLESA
jgi:phosphoribosylglycinamide formyltransferase-1